MQNSEVSPAGAPNCPPTSSTAQPTPVTAAAQKMFSHGGEAVWCAAPHCYFHKRHPLIEKSRKVTISKPHTELRCWLMWLLRSLKQAAYLTFAQSFAFGHFQTRSPRKQTTGQRYIKNYNNRIMPIRELWFVNDGTRRIYKTNLFYVCKGHCIAI